MKSLQNQQRHVPSRRCQKCFSNIPKEPLSYPDACAMHTWPTALTVEGQQTHHQHPMIGQLTPPLYITVHLLCLEIQSLLVQTEESWMQHPLPLLLKPSRPTISTPSLALVPTWTSEVSGADWGQSQKELCAKHTRHQDPDTHEQFLGDIQKRAKAHSIQDRPDVKGQTRSQALLCLPLLLREYSNQDGFASRFPARLVRLLEESVDVGDGEQDIALCEEPHAGDDIALPIDDKWL
ncbi:MAG: hypothetical protein FRX49_10946 [Trebouxia sp. A1-2]|nr:MAG: hypothetical protein FRX49_10946 [Trebouxia sp. A1-2]